LGGNVCFNKRASANQGSLDNFVEKFGVEVLRRSYRGPPRMTCLECARSCEWFGVFKGRVDAAGAPGLAGRAHDFGPRLPRSAGGVGGRSMTEVRRFRRRCRDRPHCPSIHHWPETERGGLRHNYLAASRERAAADDATTPPPVRDNEEGQACLANMYGKMSPSEAEVSV